MQLPGKGKRKGSGKEWLQWLSEVLVVMVGEMVVVVVGVVMAAIVGLCVLMVHVVVDLVV